MKHAIKRRRTTGYARPIILLALLCLPARGADPPEASGIHAIVAVDGRSRIRGIDNNSELMKGQLDLIANMGIAVTTDRLDPQRVAPGEIVSRIRALDPKKLATQTLIVYYAGHGATDPQRGHYLSTSWGPLFRSTLLAEIVAKKPRLAIIVTDCCSVVTVAKAAMVPAPPPAAERIARNLLLQHKGIVDINGSSYRPEEQVFQVACYSDMGVNGGVFTNAFAEMLGGIGEERKVLDFDDNKDDFVDWSEAFEFLKVETSEKYRYLRDRLVNPAWAGNRPLSLADPREINRIKAQRSQDPQLFGEIAIRADAKEAPPIPKVPPSPRFGVTVDPAIGIGGVVVRDVTDKMPASRVRVIRNGAEDPKPVPMVRGDLILRVNGRRVMNVAEFLREVNRVPKGGTLTIEGEEFDPNTGQTRDYKASTQLD